jgi:hypothetical protein
VENENLDTLLTALQVKVDDEIEGTRWMGRPASLTELACLAVAQVLLESPAPSMRSSPVNAATQTAGSCFRSSGRRYRDAGGRWEDGPAVREERPGIVKHHDAVAQQAPSLLRMASHRPRGDAIRRPGIRALRTVRAGWVSQRTC